MAVKRLVDSVIFGFGASAGAKLFRELEEKVAREQESDEQRVDRERREATDRAKAEKRAARETQKARARRAAEVEAELEALKKRMR